MILRSITLHPFAGISNETVHFKEKLNVLIGKNETGKSTLFNAIHAALFIPVPPRKGSEDAKKLDKFYPRNGSNVMQLTLVFTCEGQEYTLIKKWSKDAKLQEVRLVSGGRIMNGNDPVEAELARLLRFSRASWEHILFIPQSSIRHTIEQLRSRSGEVFDLGQLPGIIAGDIDPNMFLSRLDKEIKDIYGRWDKPGNTAVDGRGPENPWKNGAGDIYKKWLEYETYRLKLEELKKMEKGMDECNGQLVVLMGQSAKWSSEVALGEPLLKDATTRSEKENLLLEAKGRLQPLQDIFVVWSPLTENLPAREQQMKDEEKRLSNLSQELAHAKKNAVKKNIFKQFSLIQRMKDEIIILEQQKNDRVFVKDTVIDEVNTLLADINEIKINITSQHLIVDVKASGPATLRAEIPGEGSKTIELIAGQQEQLSATGSMQLDLASVSLRLKSGNIDIDELERRLRGNEFRLASILQEFRVKTPEELFGIRKYQDELEENIRIKRVTFSTGLQSRTYEEWEKGIKELEQVPASREESVVQREFNDVNLSVSRLQESYATDKRKLDGWVREYVSVTELMEKIVSIKSDMKILEEALKNLQPLPPGYADTTAFLNHMNQSRHKLDSILANIKTLELQKKQLETKLEGEDFSAAELEDMVRKLQMDFEREKQRATALEEVRTVVHQLIGTVNDPFVPVRANVSLMMSELTGQRYGEVKMEGNLPSVLLTNGIEITPDLLSGGTAGSLALALRMAYAKFYLGDMSGFLMLDDSLTEMDSDRDALAAAAIQELAREKQVLYFSCHHHHAGLFPKDSHILREQRLLLVNGNG